MVVTHVEGFVQAWAPRWAPTTTRPPSCRVLVWTSKMTTLAPVNSNSTPRRAGKGATNPFIFCLSLPNGKLGVFASGCPMSLLSLSASVVRAAQRGLRSEWCRMAGTLRQGRMLSSTLDRYPVAHLMHNLHVVAHSIHILHVLPVCG